ncbi:DAK2 domain-containing protein [Sedimentibacter sp. zth1]|uniref:DAK2 domain-containing protein n=1 Tax=Sedimentibacter sp. zth1 TaxID=2816908 RepID=UPI001A9278E1|nr:DAK2 domain-containing protein [Sedimentibacter sp. zth1]QSX06612.1 DAK2 domain-containing protein [Sedimentibacter sp. zth1]
MVINYIDNVMLKKMILGGATNLENNRGLVDSLNVFPVPDGDTGTNMNLTVQSAVKEINNLTESSIQNLADASAKGSLMGARGNSGVILSQLFRGFAKGVNNVNQLTPCIVASAFKNASDTAYKAVMKPIEGTILTVARETAEKAVEICDQYSDMILFLEELIKQAKITLDKTPDLLPVLKQAEVVDAGGKGLVCLLEGALAALKGVEIVKQQNTNEVVETQAEVSEFGSEDEILFTYCTEFMIKDAKISHEEFLPFIMDKGDSIVCVGVDGIIKTHIHTNNPGLILSKAVRFGEIMNIKIENMKEQFRAKIKEAPVVSKEKKKFAFISIGFGEGIQKVFYDLNVDYFISGGQTMNPSTEDIIEAVNKLNAEHIIILPNNSNIILAAQQAKDLSEKDLHVIPTKTIPQGISAMLAFNEESNIEDNVKEMEEAIKNVKTGQVTYAVRDTSMNGFDIKKDDIIALFDKNIVNHGANIEEQTLELIKKMVSDDNFLVTIFYGDTLKEEEAKSLKCKVEEIIDFCDVEIVYGGQPLYYYIIAVE